MLGIPEFMLFDFRCPSRSRDISGQFLIVRYLDFRCDLARRLTTSECRLNSIMVSRYLEDFVRGLFSIRGPRDGLSGRIYHILCLGSPLLDIERGLVKLEKVAVRRRAERDRKRLPKRPLVLIINSLHLLQDDEAGTALLELLQQKSETWAEVGVITMVLNRYRTFLLELRLVTTIGSMND